MDKNRIVIDTNIFISGLLGSRNAKFLLKEIINDAYELVMSNEQLSEIKTILLRPKFEKYIFPEEIDELITLLSMKVIVPAIYDKIEECRDCKDNMILEEAVYGNARYIISGDQDLLVLNPFKWIKILSLKEFISEMYDL